MSDFFNNFKTYFVFALLVTVISFGGSYDSGKNNSDPDNLFAQQFTGSDNISASTGYQTLYLPAGFPIRTESESSLLDTMILAANPSPSNNGGSAGWAMFLDLIGGTRNVNVTQMSTANTGTASQVFSVEVFTRHGTSLGGPVSVGPGSSTAGWTSIGIVPATQGPTANGVSLVFTIPTITVNAHDTVGVAVKFTTVGPRYFGTGSPPLSTYSDTNITLITGEGRSAPFTTTGSWFSSRAMNGEIRYVVTTITGIHNISAETPNGFRLEQNYPNPFNPSTTIQFAILKKSNVTLKIYNARGQEVEVLVNDNYAAGTYSVSWKAADHPSGIYFYRLITEGFTETKKMILVK